MYEKIKEIFSNTLVLAKSLDFFEEFRVPGKDYKIIACQASEELTKKYPDVYVDEVIKGRRTYTTSRQLLDILQNSLEYKRNVNCNYVWTYQSYPWTNDLKYSGKTVFSIDYYLYLKLQNKLTQRKLLIEQTSQIDKEASNLKANLLNSSSLLKTKVFPKQKLDYKDLKDTYGDDFVVCASISNGGEGVFKISTMHEYYEALRNIDTPVIRTEMFLENSIPLNQIGFVLSNGMVIKYKPSVQIIKNIHQPNKMEYAGCDFYSDNYLDNSYKTLTNVTELTHSIGVVLFKMGYRGTFGCDYLVTDDNIHFIELNPRYQASTLIPNLHLGNNELFAPHVLHILGYTDFSAQHFPELKMYAASQIFIDFIQNGKPIGFLNIYEDDIINFRRPAKSIEIDAGISKGYLLYDKSIITNPYFPTTLSFTQ